MIHYRLKCAKGHDFDGWFKSAAGYDALRGAGHVACTICGSAEVEKALMAPAVSLGTTADTETPRLDTPANDVERAIAEMRRHVEDNAEYVGMEFATKARAMHEGEIPATSIYGETRLEEAKAMLEEGIPVAPLPFTPRRKAH